MSGWHVKAYCYCATVA